MKNKSYGKSKGGRIQVKKSFIRMKPKYLDLNRNSMPFPVPVPVNPEPIRTERPVNQAPVPQEEIDDIFLGYSTRRGGRKTRKTRKTKKTRKNKSKKYRK